MPPGCRRHGHTPASLDRQVSLNTHQLIAEVMAGARSTEQHSSLSSANEPGARRPLVARDFKMTCYPPAGRAYEVEYSRAGHFGLVTSARGIARKYFHHYRIIESKEERSNGIRWIRHWRRNDALWLVS
jgi:hypothetical protein